MQAKRLLRIALFGLGSIFFLVLCGAAYLGAFAPITVTERQMGPFYLVYEEARSSDQREIGQITTRLANLISERHLGRADPLDAFYPAGQGPNQIGFALSAPPTQTDLGPTVKIRYIPAQASMVAQFPWRSPFSFAVGYLRVEPALRQYRSAHGYRNGPAYVLDRGPTITYIQPLLR